MKNILFLVMFIISFIFASQGSDKFDIGMKYLLGKGLKQDKQKAFTYLSEAANEGDVAAEYNLALMYYMGDGVEQNISKSVILLDSSARKGYAKSIENVGRIYMQILKFDKAIYWLKMNVKNGDFKANYLLAESFIQKDDYKNAKIYAKKAMAGGDVDAKLLFEEYKLSNY